ncbi:MAG: DUF1501 domain-containing protein, partial [Verrucomicrobiae bacterium]|nr:DUF1501 domain-containing protein [Verrucomicrobiae bacterium]
MLGRCANGFGMVALMAMLAERSSSSPSQGGDSNAGDTDLEVPGHLHTLHHAPKVRNVIFLYMDGGPSQVDTFDYKPMLHRFHGRDPHSVFRVEPTQFNNIGRVMESPWNFRRYGQCGRWVSDLFPHIARHVDDLCFVHSME